MKKIRFYDHLLYGATGAVCAVGALLGMVDMLSGFSRLKALLNKSNGSFLLSLLLAVVLLAVLVLGVVCILRLVRAKKTPQFVQLRTEQGVTNIASTAVDELVRKCVATHDELKLSESSLQNTRDGLLIKLRLSLASGVSIPLAVPALQKQLKHYISSSTGLDVHEVRVQVDTAELKDLTPTAYVLPDLLNPTPVEEHAEIPSPLLTGNTSREEEEMPLHQRIFQAEEQPMVVPMPPVEEQTEGFAAEEGTAAYIEAEAAEEAEEAEEIEAAEEEEVPEGIEAPVEEAPLMEAVNEEIEEPVEAADEEAVETEATECEVEAETVETAEEEAYDADDEPELPKQYGEEVQL